ncbi:MULTISPECIES: peptidoglycan-associated lipoprotein Pal [unclassified Lentilitoribacter]|jgi:peptidoglycan-associated lipoprotein|uniref:peptidoglycan-associated lipoprotein Pal n=1 Tax=unclassified Lentilitoribacter TaxID=2647570 RepID=UPI0013A6E15D|nr:peptidoglycan-associated lipoprotein Pal [Lentilitoribacter sp. Alg239-R112]
MSGLASLSHSRVLIALFLGLTLAGCASKKNQLPNNVGDLGLTANGAVPGSLQDFTQNVGDIVYFDTDSSVIRGDAANILVKQVAWLNQYPDKIITIEGHADERGTREYNLALGARRAAATRDYLISQGLTSARIKTLSLGKERPVAVCDDISCWSQNRRAQTKLLGVNS